MHEVASRGFLTDNRVIYFTLFTLGTFAAVVSLQTIG